MEDKPEVKCVTLLTYYICLWSSSRISFCT